MIARADKVEIKVSREITYYIFSSNDSSIDRFTKNKRFTHTHTLSLSFFPDLTDMDNYKKIADTVNEKVGGNGLNVLFNNAGISSKFTRLGLVKKRQITDVFLLNTVAPIMLTKVRLQSFHVH